MPISRDEFEGRGIDWGQRILAILNSDRSLAYSENELITALTQKPTEEQLSEALDQLVKSGFVVIQKLGEVAYYAHYLH